MSNAVLNVFLDLYSGLFQQGPGSDESTRAALSRLPGLDRRIDILDLGCGSGRQTLALAASTTGQIVALDLSAPYLDALRVSLAEAGLADRVEVLQGSMEDPPVGDRRFDLIWSEGAIYNIGFRNGLTRWQRRLRPGGCLAVTELSWLSVDRPSSAVNFWAAGYPAMQTTEENRLIIERLGYELIGDFTLPESDWWTGYYDEVERRIARMRDASDDDEILAALTEHQHEIDVFRDREESFGYVFYLMRLPTLS